MRENLETIFDARDEQTHSRPPLTIVLTKDLRLSVERLSLLRHQVSSILPGEFELTQCYDAATYADYESIEEGRPLDLDLTAGTPLWQIDTATPQHAANVL